MSRHRPKLLTIGHSYCVALNRRLPVELARCGWDVTTVGPARFRGDFGWHTLESSANDSCRVVPVPVRFGRQVHLMWYGRELSTLLAEPWDVVHCWVEPYVAAAAQIARLLPARVPLVYATFQNISKQYPPPFRWIESRAMKRANGVVAFGETTAQTVGSRGLFQGPMAVIPPGVDITSFRPDGQRRASMRTRLGWSDAVPVVGFVGRLVPEKGIEVLTDVLDRVEQRWRALFVGTGPMRDQLQAWSRRHGDRVQVITDAQHDEVPAFLNAMDLLCAPSRTTVTWREQFGRMLIEAFASEVAVIASTSGEIPHVVADAGLLVPEDDRAAWQRAIELLIADPVRRRELARQGRERAVGVYDWSRVARQHIRFFEEVIACAA